MPFIVVCRRFFVLVLWSMLMFQPLSSNPSTQQSSLFKPLQVEPNRIFEPRKCDSGLWRILKFCTQKLDFHIYAPVDWNDYFVV